MYIICGGRLISKCSSENQGEIGCSKADNANAHSNALVAKYGDMVSILQMFTKAERMANWKLHIQTVQDMLPYFAASRHSLYAKAAYVYLQIMLRLP